MLIKPKIAFRCLFRFSGFERKNSNNSKMQFCCLRWNQSFAAGPTFDIWTRMQLEPGLTYLKKKSIETVYRRIGSCQLYTNTDLHVLLLFTFCGSNQTHRSFLYRKMPKCMFMVSILHNSIFHSNNIKVSWVVLRLCYKYFSNRWR